MSTFLAIATLRKGREKLFNIIRIAEEQENPGDVEISFLVILNFEQFTVQYD